MAKEVADFLWNYLRDNFNIESGVMVMEATEGQKYSGRVNKLKGNSTYVSNVGPGIVITLDDKAIKSIKKSHLIKQGSDSN